MYLRLQAQIRYLHLFIMLISCYIIGCISHLFLVIILSKVTFLFIQKQPLQGRSEGTLSVAFEVLIISCEIDLINLLIFTYLTSNLHLVIFTCLTSNINLFNFNCLTLNFCFPKKHIFRKQKRTTVYGRTSLVSSFKLTQKNDNLLSLRH